MPIRYMLSFPEIIIESILFTFFLSRRMEWKKPFAFHLPEGKPSLKRHGRSVPNSDSAMWDARAWKAAFCCLTILASSMVHIFLRGNLSTGTLQVLSFLVRMLLVSFFFRSTFSDKAFHICLLCFMGLFADQASCLAEHLYSSQGRHPLENWLYHACSFTDYALFCNITNSIRSTLFYLGFEYIVMCLFLFSLKDISRLSEKAYGLLVAVTAAALLVSTYFLGRILMLDAGMLPFRYQAQFYLISLLILTLFLSTLLLHQITGRAFSENMELAEQLHIREKNEARNQALLQSAESLQKWKHDYKNHLAAMQGLIEEGAYGQLEEYIQNQLESLPQAFPTVDTGHRVIDAVLTHKIALAQRAGISFQHSVILPEELPLNGPELTGILGNLLDNALEACQKAAGAEPFISFVMKPKRGMLHIGVRNRSPGEYRYSEDGKLETTKEDPEIHGKGLANVAGIVESHAGFCQIHAEKAYFDVGVYIPL